DFAGALESYRQLARCGDVRTAGLPAELAGLDGQRLTLAKTGNRTEEAAIAARMADYLDNGRWQLTRGTAEYYRAEVTQSRVPKNWLLAQALSQLWAASAGQVAPRGQQIVTVSGDPVLVQWRSNGRDTIVLLAFADGFFSSNLPSGFAYGVIDSEGRRVAGKPAPKAPSVTRLIGDSQYPWMVRIWPEGAPAASGTR